MKPDEFDPLELAGLCDALIDGVIDDVGRGRLSRRLVESEEVRRFYVRYMDLSSSLGHYSAELQTDPPEAVSVLSRVIRHPAARWCMGALAAAAAVLFLFSVVRPWYSRGADDALNTGSFVAVLVQTKECRWAPGSAVPRLGEHLSRGQVISLAGGFAEIAFDCGAVVVIEGPATLELDSAWGATLRRGVLRAQVPPEAIGFRISNPAVEVVDLGTEFAVVADGNGAAEVLVLKGSVEAAADGRPVILREKEGRRFGKTGASDVRDRDPKIERLAQRLTLDVPPAAIAYAQWSFEDAGGDVAVARLGGLSRIVPDFRVESRHEVMCVEGRWGRALRFDGAFSATASLSGIAPDSGRTVAFWVQLPPDVPLFDGGTILAWKAKAKSRKAGSPATLLGWNRHPGQGAMGALRADRGPDAVVGTTPLCDGKWHHVAAIFVPAVRGGKLFHVRLYVDGRLEAATASKPKRAGQFADESAMTQELAAADALWIGRAPGGRPRSERFVGALDELFVADRALTHMEIRRLMRTNEPTVPAVAASDGGAP